MTSPSNPTGSEVCLDCQGEGWRKGCYVCGSDADVICPACHGTGKVEPAPPDPPSSTEQGDGGERDKLRKLIDRGVEAVARGDATEAISSLIWANVEAALDEQPPTALPEQGDKGTRKDGKERERTAPPDPHSPERANVLYSSMPVPDSRDGWKAQAEYLATKYNELADRWSEENERAEAAEARIASLQVGLAAANQRDALRENAEIERLEAELEAANKERDRSWRTINEIENLLQEHGVAITFPLADAVRSALTEGESDG